MKNATRIFPGHVTRQVTIDGRPALTDRWYWEPASYEGDVLWSIGYATRDEAEAAAREYVDAGGEQ